MSTHYETRRSTSQYWYNKASDLMSAAAAIRFASSDKEVADRIIVAAGLGAGFDLSIATYQVFCMLCGLALELAYKAIIVQEGKEPPTNHVLLALAKAAGLELNEKDIVLLKIWSQLIIWDGKYPVPKNEERMNAYGDLIDTALWDRVEDTPIKHMNNRIGWTSFRGFWNRANERYFATRNQAS